MKIIECCPFFNENLIANIHIEEASKWVDQIHITEADYSYQYGRKSFNFNQLYNSGKLHYHPIEVENIFLKKRKTIPHFKPFGRSRSHRAIFKQTSWYNEGCQRNLSAHVAYDDDDILIFSDVDEIIIPDFADRIVEEVKRRGIVTVKLHLTFFYFNLFCKSFAGPGDYSYRTFVVRGKEFRENWKNDSDWLRKLGEHGKLINKVFCIEPIVGFHHSWLGDAQFCAQKLRSFAHEELAVYNNSPEYINDCLQNNISIFPNHQLAVNHDIKLLDAVEALRHEQGKYFL
jgi:hypothetical protein